MKCPECGVEIKEEGKFCKNCGKSLTEPVSKNRNVTILVIGIAILVFIVILTFLAFTSITYNNSTQPKKFSYIQNGITFNYSNIIVG